ncbi:ABC transporter ATP-binding protein [Ekhidna sp.]|uniref:ABC transporter ATP-binding protein n=1 Tax=Ekhidna sp. TaxID=2608089 RepID=UPI003B5BF474
MNYKEADIETLAPSNTREDSVPAVEIIDLKKSFGNNHVLKGFNLSIKQGENVAVLGKSGSGKSVLIKCIVGLIKPDSGQIKVFGRDVVNLDRQELDEVRSKIGFLFQSNALYDSLTVRENLEFPMRRLRIKKTKAEVDQMVHEALTSVGLPDVQELMPASLSGGMKKRVGVARTLILQPDIILYDEPTSGLDPITSREIANLMNDVHRKYKTSSIIISHDMSCIKRTAHRIVVLNDGIDYQQGSYEELKNSTDEIVNSFFL